MGNQTKIHAIFAIFLFCIILASSVATVKADVILADDFEEATLSNNWSLTFNANIVKAKAESGAQSIQIPLSSSAIKTTFSPSAALTVEFYFLTDTLPDSVDPSLLYSYLRFIGLTTDQGFNAGCLGINRDNEGKVTWYFQDRAMHHIQSNIQENTWYKFDLAIKVDSNEFSYQVSIDDKPVYSGTSPNSNSAVTTLQIGSVSKSQGGFAQNGFLYFDNLKIMNSVVDWEPTTTPTQSLSTSATPMAIEPTISPTQIPNPIVTAQPIQPNQGEYALFSADVNALVVAGVVILVVVFICIFAVIRRKPKQQTLPTKN